MKINKKALSILVAGGIGISLVGCETKQAENSVIPIEKLTKLDKTVIGLPLDDEISEDEELLLDLYNETQLDYMYQEAITKTMYIYANGLTVETFEKLIQENKEAKKLERLYVKACKSNDKEEIQALQRYLTKEAEKRNFTIKDSLVVPLAAASNVRFRNNENWTLDTYYPEEQVLEISKDKIKKLIKEIN